MRTTITTFIAILLLTCSYSNAAYFDFPFIAVKGEGTVSLAPNIANLKFTITATEKESSRAFQIVNERSMEVAEFFSECGIRVEDIDSHRINKRTVYKEGNFKGVTVEGYEVTRTFDVSILDLGNFSEIIDHLIGLENLDDIRSDFDVSNRSEVEGELLKKACENARATAVELAEGFQVKLGEVNSITKNSDGLDYLMPTLEPAYRGPPESRYGDIQLGFIPSNIQLSISVTAVYEIER